MTEIKTKCRGCGKPLTIINGFAYDNDKEIYSPQCQYGGNVCSRDCDIEACVVFERSMPGCNNVNGYFTLSCYAKEQIDRNWRNRE